MSYILDALKKADAERERHGVPSLSAHSATMTDDERRGGRGASMAIVAALAALALGAWWWSGRDNNAAAPAPALAAAPTSPSVAATPSPPTPAMPAKAVTPLPPVIVPPAPVVASPAPTVSTVAPPPVATGRVPTLDELGPDLRRQLPTLSVSGAVYSPQASGRMVFINGQVLREGDAVADGLVVERIGAKSSVLSMRGTRFEIKH